jgi:hypothetical protein
MAMPCAAATAAPATHAVIMKMPFLILPLFNYKP